MPDFNPAMRAAWQMAWTGRGGGEVEHYQAIQEANAATAAAIATAQINVQAQAASRASTIAALQVHLAALAPVVATNADATVHLQAAQTLAAQLS